MLLCLSWKFKLNEKRFLHRETNLRILTFQNDQARRNNSIYFSLDWSTWRVLDHYRCVTNDSGSYQTNHQFCSNCINTINRENSKYLPSLGLNVVNVLVIWLALFCLRKQYLANVRHFRIGFLLALILCGKNLTHQITLRNIPRVLCLCHLDA